MPARPPLSNLSSARDVKCASRLILGSSHQVIETSVDCSVLEATLCVPFVRWLTAYISVPINVNLISWHCSQPPISSPKPFTLGITQQSLNLRSPLLSHRPIPHRHRYGRLFPRDFSQPRRGRLINTSTSKVRAFNISVHPCCRIHRENIMIWISSSINPEEHPRFVLYVYLWRSLRAFIHFSQFYGAYQSLPPWQRRGFVETWKR